MSEEVKTISASEFFSKQKSKKLTNLDNRIKSLNKELSEWEPHKALGGACEARYNAISESLETATNKRNELDSLNTKQFATGLHQEKTIALENAKTQFKLVDEHYQEFKEESQVFIDLNRPQRDAIKRAVGQGKLNDCNITSDKDARGVVYKDSQLVAFILKKRTKKNKKTAFTLELV